VQRSEPLLTCEGVSFSYLGRFPALRELSFEVETGESVAVLGANGCGKSTLLKILGGLVFADEGSCRAFGHELSERALSDDGFSLAFRARTGFVFQNSDAQVFSPTVREEVAFGPLQLGLERDEVERRVSDALAMLEISELAERAPYQLSAGQKKRVALASVLVSSPELLLVDEPTAGLDPRSRQWLLELFGELRGAGKTIVLATHELDQLEWITNRCLVLSEEHRLIASGPPSEILADFDLLLAANLIHEHAHRDGPLVHAYSHSAAHHRESAGRVDPGCSDREDC